MTTHGTTGIRFLKSETIASDLVVSGLTHCAHDFLPSNVYVKSQVDYIGSTNNKPPLHLLLQSMPTT